MKDYKEVWNQAYYEALARGLTEDEAAQVADDILIDWYANMIDNDMKEAA